MYLQKSIHSSMRIRGWKMFTHTPKKNKVLFFFFLMAESATATVVLSFLIFFFTGTEMNLALAQPLTDLLKDCEVSPQAFCP